MSAPKISKNCVVAVRARSTLWRDRTAEEHEAWENSPASKGMNDAGETKLDSPSRYRNADGRTYKVARSRVQCRRGWSTVGKCAELIDSEGVHWFAYRKDLFVVREA